MFLESELDNFVCFVIIHKNAHCEVTMKTVRINISLPEDLLDDISREVGSRKRSRFIAEAVARSLKEQRDRRLAAEYEAAAAEISRINRELEGAAGDGID
jgi:metal-responsive CopG/Arc/MetJ family transcriptional regulator